MNYGSKIAELRKSNNLTQAELGAKLNVTAQAVSKWENGLSEPDIDSIKKLCELFSVSVDQFLDFSKKDSEDETATTDSSAPAHAQTLVIHGYCEKCNKPVGPREYAVTNLSFNPSNKNKTVTNDPNRQHIFCNECHKQIVETKKTEEKNALLLKLAKETAEKKHNFFKGLIWSGVITLFVGLLFIISCASDPTALTGAIIITVGSFTMSTQLFWDADGALGTFFFFFCRSFKWPFGFIFELSLDGIIWLLTVKLALWIICGILSAIFFLIGLVLSLFVSVVTFPFSLVSNIRALR